MNGSISWFLVLLVYVCTSEPTGEPPRSSANPANSLDCLDLDYYKTTSWPLAFETQTIQQDQAPRLKTGFYGNIENVPCVNLKGRKLLILRLPPLNCFQSLEIARGPSTNAFTISSPTNCQF